MRGLCLALTVSALSPCWAAPSNSIARVTQSVSATSVTVGESFVFRVSVDPLAEVEGRLALAVSMPDALDPGNVAVESVTNTSGRGGLASECGQTAREAAGPEYYCYQAQWPLISRQHLRIRVTPSRAGIFRILTEVHSDGGHTTASDLGGERQTFVVEVSEANPACINVSAVACAGAQGQSQVHVSYLRPARLDLSRAASIQTEQNRREATSWAVGVGNGLLVPRPHIDTFSNDTFVFPYLLADISRQAGAVGHSHFGQMRFDAAIETWSPESTNTPMFDDNNVWTGFVQAAGVDAHVHAAMVYDYLLTRFGRNSFDGLGSTMRTDVNLQNQCSFIWCWGESPDLAGWTGSSVRIGLAVSRPSYAAALDAIAHEWAHGITEAVGGPIVYERESGALNEAFSDWFGTAVEWADGESNWTIGEGAQTIRDISDPPRLDHPDTYGGRFWKPTTDPICVDDYCGVHTNSGVPNKMFYLLSAGGTHNRITVTGIGVQRAMRIAYDANRIYWTPTSSFHHARSGMISAASTAFEKDQVRNAWKAVGVISAPSQPSNPNPAAGSAAVSLSPTLSWSPSTDAVSYDVYFGTTSPPPFAGNTTNTNFSPGTLQPSTTYYWGVEARGDGRTVSDLWSFTTAAPACAYSLAPTSISPAASGGPAWVNVVTTAGCPWTAVSNAPWITITSGSPGTGNGTVNFNVAANTANTPRTGTISIAGLTFTVSQPAAGNVVNPVPTVGVPTPSAGVGLTQSFTFTFQDPNGASNLTVLNVLINNAIDGRNSCYLAYVPSGTSTGTLLVVNDAGDAGGPFAGSLQVPSVGNAGNSQCTVVGTGTSASMSGDTLTLTLVMSFSASYSGNRVVYAAARNLGGHNSGWRAKGVWTVPGTPTTSPSVVSLTPTRASANSTVITARFSDSNGFADLNILNMLINDAIDGRNACYIAFIRSSATLVLVNDAGAAGGPFAGTLGIPGSGIVSNNQCSINAAGSSVTGSGNELSLALNVSFSGPFTGDRIVYLAARDQAENNSGWQAKGTITVP